MQLLESLRMDFFLVQSNLPFTTLGKHFQLDFEMEIQFGYTRKASLKGNDFSNPQRIICDLFPIIGLMLIITLPPPLIYPRI